MYITAFGPHSVGDVAILENICYSSYTKTIGKKAIGDVGKGLQTCQINITGVPESPKVI